MNTKSPKFISSLPEGKDIFADKSHENICETICKVITSHESCSKLIGLEGKWGSGKSNVVKMLADKLKKDYHVFIYDAWGHQEDLQRKAILESLIGDLVSSQQIKKEFWEKELKTLLSAKKEIITKTIPKLSLSIIFLLLILYVLTPLTNQWLDHYFKFVDFNIWTLINSNASKPFPWYLVVKIFVPIFWGGLFYGVHYLLSLKKDTERVKISELLYVYKNKELEDSKCETISENEPSVREFRLWMERLSSKLNKGLIIVFDNMDRLPEDKVKKLWSLIHTFFSESDYKNIWVIVPYDREHLNEAFDDCGCENFINKTFHVNLRVTPPALTDWRHFFDTKMKEAFDSTTDVSDKELEFVKRIFLPYCKDITPRNIISFINELVSIRISVSENIALRYMALFITMKNNLKDADAVKAILMCHQNIPVSCKSIFNNDDNVQNYLASILYNVPLETAGQVLLSNEIEQAINNNEPDRLNLVATHKHFFDVLEHVIFNNNPDLSQTILTLSKFSGFDEKIYGNKLKHIWHVLARTFLGQSIESQNYTTSNQALFSAINGTDDWLCCVRHWRNEIQSFDDFNAIKYCVALDAFKRMNKGVDYDVFYNLNKREIGPEEFIGFVRYNKDSYHKYNISCNNDSLCKFLKDTIAYQDSKLDFDLSFMKYTSVEYDYSDLITYIESISSFLNRKVCERVISIYKAISNKRPIKTLVPDQLLYSYINEYNNQDKDSFFYDLIAMVIAKGGKFSPNNAYSEFANSTIKRVDDVISDGVIKCIDYYIDFNDLLLGLTSSPNALYKQVVKKLILSKDFGNRLALGAVLPKFKFIYETIDGSAKDLLLKLNFWDATKVITKDNVLDLIKDVEFYRAATDNPCELAKRAISCLIEKINLHKKDFWFYELRNNQNGFACHTLFHLIEKDYIKTLSKELVQAYIEYIKSCVTEQKVTHDRTELLYNLISKRVLVPVFRDIRDVFIDKNNINAVLFIHYVPKLIEHGSLNQKASDVVRTIFNVGIRNHNCFEIILQNKDKIAGIVNKAGAEAFAFIEDVKKNQYLKELSVLLN